MRLVDIDARECWACAHHCKNGGCSVWCENGEAFELRADLKEAAIVEAVPVVYGEWIPVHKHMWQKDKNGEIDEWAMSYDFHNGPICEICFDTPCVHCKPDWKTTECHKESYECSECQNHVKAKTNFCSNCGAKMTKQN